MSVDTKIAMQVPAFRVKKENFIMRLVCFESYASVEIFDLAIGSLAEVDLPTS